MDRAREKLNGVCRVCRVCDGFACRGEVPGFGGAGSGASFMNNVSALAAVKLNVRVLHGASEPKTGTSLFGVDLKFPIIGAPVAGVRINRMAGVTERELAEAMICGPAMAGTLGSGGDGAVPEVFDSGLEMISRRTAGRGGIVIIKPVSQEVIVEKIALAEKAGADAVGVDVDAAAFVNMTLAGRRVEPKTPKMISELVAASRVPFIVKGVMSVADAEAAAEAGAAAVVVSNHGGRVIDHTPGTAEVLPEISRAVRGKTKVLVDGGIRSGVDVLKMLALGADAVLVGRPLAVAAIGGGAQAVKLRLERIGEELKAAMIMTGCPDLGAVDTRVIRGR
ncbi:MAG: alpha-hydroxy-acid oxidizing protein [Firmicutes bacterium]|jgi:isopentenyl diphosphate isomerase/L-lactate dehydrogenase-like FMN-dependent dehydrogenase|nr:alpha-hydroxy-acid oxidizing protein [Bacillota bacterium]